MLVEDGGTIDSSNLAEATCPYCNRKLRSRWNEQGLKLTCLCGAKFALTPMSYEIFEQEGPKEVA